MATMLMHYELQVRTLDDDDWRMVGWQRTLEEAMRQCDHVRRYEPQALEARVVSVTRTVVEQRTVYR